MKDPMKRLPNLPWWLPHAILAAIIIGGGITALVFA